MGGTSTSTRTTDLLKVKMLHSGKLRLTDARKHTSGSVTLSPRFISHQRTVRLSPVFSRTIISTFYSSFLPYTFRYVVFSASHGQRVHSPFTLERSKFMRWQQRRRERKPSLHARARARTYVRFHIYWHNHQITYLTANTASEHTLYVTVLLPAALSNLVLDLHLSSTYVLRC